MESLKKVQKWCYRLASDYESHVWLGLAPCSLERRKNSWFVICARSTNLCMTFIRVGPTTFLSPQPLRAPGYCHRPSGWEVGRSRTVKVLTSVIFYRSFSNLVRTFIALRSHTVWLWRFCLIKYVHNGLFNELFKFWHPWTHFQAKVTKFDTHVGLNILINISSSFVMATNFLANFSFSI